MIGCLFAALVGATPQALGPDLAALGEIDLDLDLARGPALVTNTLMYYYHPYVIAFARALISTCWWAVRLSQKVLNASWNSLIGV